MAVKFDEIGYWSEVKLDIIREYATAYSIIMNKQHFLKGYYYIDGFAGAGVHISKISKDYIPGSPLNALNVNPPFHAYYFIDLNGDKADHLRELSKERSNVTVFKGDCNQILLNEIFPQIKYSEYKRALCLLDPYGLHLDWEVMCAAGKSGAIEIFLNFPVMDMNMNVLKINQDKVDESQIERMNAFWGDESWRDVAYQKTPGLFEDIECKTTNEHMVQAFREKLKNVAGFEYVPDPIPMRNTTGGTLYYLFFASASKTGGKIVGDIFKKYKDKGL